MQALFRDKGIGGFIQTDENELAGRAGYLLLALQLSFLVAGGVALDRFTKTLLLSALGAATLWIAFRLQKASSRSWMEESWGFAKKTIPYLFIGVFAAEVLSALLPESVVRTLLGGNSLFSNFFGSVYGVLMYFATLTEIQIVQSLMQLGMGKGPVLALFMSGNALSLPSMIVLTRVLGKKKARTYFVLVALNSMCWGFIYGNL